MQSSTCQNCRQPFVIDEMDLAFYKRIKVPSPTFCPLCRVQRRFAFRNERFLHKRRSDFSGKEIFAAFAPETPIKVYENSVWFSDQWDPMQYGRDVDFSRPFLEQIHELLQKVPIYATSTIYGVNSEYSNNYTGLKNCYLVFNADYDEDCSYAVSINYSKDCIDASYIEKCELCYEGFMLTGCSHNIFSSRCENSFNLAFCDDCRGCNDCFGCVGLRNKQYYIFNKPYSKKEYQQKLQEWNLGSYVVLQKLKQEVKEFFLCFPNKFMDGMSNTNVNGEYIYHSKNVADSYFIREGENLRYCQGAIVPKTKDSYDYSIWGSNTELAYESAVCGMGASRIKFCHECWNEVQDMEYSSYCGSGSHLFGCVGLRKKHYCILNKQYTQSEYEALVPKIIGHMNAMPYTDKAGRVYRYGEFFPPEFSPFAYNQTMAIEFFPLTKNEALEKGLVWREPEDRTLAKSIKAEELPDTIRETPDSILNEVIECLHKNTCTHYCTKGFRIISSELAFYREMNIALPRLCPNCRHSERISKRKPLQLWERQCQCAGKTSSNEVYHNFSSHEHGEKPCPTTFKTSYAPERKEIVYCEACYFVEVE